MRKKETKTVVTVHPKYIEITAYVRGKVQSVVKLFECYYTKKVKFCTLCGEEFRLRK